jgi:hypothetical protein
MPKHGTFVPRRTHRGLELHVFIYYSDNNALLPSRIMAVAVSGCSVGGCLCLHLRVDDPGHHADALAPRTPRRSAGCEVEKEKEILL